MNSFLHKNGVVTGEITIRMLSNTDKIFETRLGMENRSVFVCFCVCVFRGAPILILGITTVPYIYKKYWLLRYYIHICSTFLC